MAISVFVFSRIELDFVVHDWRKGDLCKVLHAKEPLHGKLGLDGHVGAFAESYVVRVRFYFFEQSGSFQVFLDLLAHLETVHADVEAGGLTECAVVVEDVNAFEIMFLAEHVVVDVMGGRHFEASRAEFDIYVFVFDDRNGAADEGDDHPFAAEPLVLRIVGVDAHGRVAHNGFWTSGGYDRIGSVGLRVVHHIAEVIEFAVLFLVDHFLV